MNILRMCMEIHYLLLLELSKTSILSIDKYTLYHMHADLKWMTLFASYNTYLCVCVCVCVCVWEYISSQVKFVMFCFLKSWYKIESDTIKALTMVIIC